jgi:hypothetical protein
MNSVFEMISQKLVVKEYQASLRRYDAMVLAWFFGRMLKSSNSVPLPLAPAVLLVKLKARKDTWLKVMEGNMRNEESMNSRIYEKRMNEFGQENHT